MKTKLTILALCALCLAADEPKKETHPEWVLPTSEVSFIPAFSVPVYTRVSIGEWLEVKGQFHPNGQSITLAGQAYFAPEDTTIIVKSAPSVTQRTDGTWAITFNKPTSVEWMTQPYSINGKLGHLGVRSDGVVVWREIKN